MNQGKTGPLFDRRQVMLALGAAMGSAALPRLALAAEGATLGALAAAKGIDFATPMPLMNPKYLTDAGRAVAALCVHEARSIVNTAKNNEIMMADGTLNFFRPQCIFDYVKPYGLPMVWHTLFWDRASPFVAGLKDRDAAIKVLKQWIEDFITHWGSYPTNSIQVVNELHFPWSTHKWGYETTDYKGGPHPWISVIGDDAPELAFRFAKAVAPAGAKLLLNERNLALISGNWGAYDKNRANILATLKRWQDAKVPIDGLGLQLHLTPGFRPIAPGRNSSLGKMDFIDPATQIDFMDKVAALGLEIHLTEFDCTDLYLPGKTIDERREACADYARKIITPLVAHKAVKSFQLGGMSDNPVSNYLADAMWDWPDGRWGKQATAPRPREAMLYDAQIPPQPKPLRQAVVDAFQAAPER